MKDLYRILVINPGSTSTKISVFENDKEISTKNIEHSSEELAKYSTAVEQYEMRKEAILNYLKELGTGMQEMDAIAARGIGRWGKYSAGAYEINDLMEEDSLKDTGTHGMILSPILANRWAKEFGIKAYVYDVVPVDELEEIARISGSPLIERIGASHTLNTKATARKVAGEMGRTYEDVTFIMCHMGGGIGANLHKNGRIIDVTSDDEGTFSPERAGRVSTDALIKLCFSGKYTEKQARKLMKGSAGLVGYLGTNDCKEVERRIAAGDRKAELIYEAMAYQIAKDIGALATVVNGNVDRIVLTGGIAYSKMMTDMITERVSFIAPVVVVPGAMEMEALEQGVIRVLRGEEEAKKYIPGKTL
ncbi:MAG: butyrate kinase [Clostridiaceae bacterium]